MVDKSKDISLKFLGAFNRNLHNRFKHDRIGFFIRFAESADCSCLESHIRRVNRVGLAVVNGNANADNGEADKRTLLYSSFKAFIARRDKFRRDRAALNLVDKLVILFGNGFDKACNTAELTGTARLLFMRIVKVRPLADRFAVGNLRHTGFNLALIFTAHTFNINIQVQLTHALDNRFIRFGIDKGAEGRIFFCKAV